jgi:hypothetical protein
MAIRSGLYGPEWDDIGWGKPNGKGAIYNPAGTDCRHMDEDLSAGTGSRIAE